VVPRTGVCTRPGFQNGACELRSILVQALLHLSTHALLGHFFNEQSSLHAPSVLLSDRTLYGAHVLSSFDKLLRDVYVR